VRRGRISNERHDRKSDERDDRPDLQHPWPPCDHRRRSDQHRRDQRHDRRRLQRVVLDSRRGNTIFNWVIPIVLIIWAVKRTGEVSEAA
jgi:hypothetical protein